MNFWHILGDVSFQFKTFFLQSGVVVISFKGRLAAPPPLILLLLAFAFFLTADGSAISKATVQDEPP
jgi:hypothetical protein